MTFNTFSTGIDTSFTSKLNQNFKGTSLLTYGTSGSQISITNTMSSNIIDYVRIIVNSQVAIGKVETNGNATLLLSAGLVGSETQIYNNSLLYFSGLDGNGGNPHAMALGGVTCNDFIYAPSASEKTNGFKINLTYTNAALIQYSVFTETS